jgi:hypothetical protein
VKSQFGGPLAVVRGALEKLATSRRTKALAEEAIGLCEALRSIGCAGEARVWAKASLELSAVAQLAQLE